MLAYLASISGVIAAGAYIPEIIKLLRLKEAHELSWVTFGIWTAHSVIWLLYGISIGQVPIILYNVLGLIGAGTVFILAIVYSRRERKATVSTGTRLKDRI